MDSTGRSGSRARPTGGHREHRLRRALQILLGDAETSSVARNLEARERRLAERPPVEKQAAERPAPRPTRPRN